MQQITAIGMAFEIVTLWGRDAVFLLLLITMHGFISLV